MTSVCVEDELDDELEDELEDEPLPATEEGTVTDISTSPVVAVKRAAGIKINNGSLFKKFIIKYMYYYYFNYKLELDNNYK